MTNIILLTGLSVCTYTDLRKKIVLLPVVILTSLGIFISLLIKNEMEIFRLLGFLFTLFLFVFVSYISSFRLGLGDSIIIGMTSLALGIYRNFFMLLIASWLAFLGALIFKFIFKKNGEYKFPFVPFILVATMVVCLYGD